MHGVDSLSLLADIIFHLLFLIILFIIAELSRILGEALKKRPVYKLMYIAYASLLIGLLFHFLNENFQLYAYILDLTGLVLGAIITYYYWKWLPGDLARG
jgi:uncharacterized protein YacL